MRQALLLVLSMIFTINSYAISISRSNNKQQKQITQEMFKLRQNTMMNNGLKSSDEMKELIQKISLDSNSAGSNYFQKMRIELNKLAAEEHQNAKRLGLLTHSTLKMPIDAFGFFIATGAINFMTMWTRAEGNPLLFYEQIMSQKDPLTHISFYAFMLANGYSTQIFTERLDKKYPDLSPAARATELRRISYLALAAGSFASTVVSEIGSTIRSCTLSWDKNSKVPVEESNAICNQALEQWSLYNKTPQYLTQISTMLIVQAATEFVQATTEGAIKLGASALYQTLKGLEYSRGFHLVAVEMALYATPGKVAVKSVSVLGKLTQFTFFVGVDHAINNTVTRGLNNIVKQLWFTLFDKSYLDCYLAWGNLYKWNEKEISTHDPACGLTIDSVEYKKYIAEELNDFKTQMQGWRTHLNSNVELDLNGWLERTNRIIKQSKLTEEFYSAYLSQLFDTANAYYRIGLPENDPNKLTRKTFSNKTEYPFRALPLFGINFVPWTKDSEIKADSAQYLYPYDTEQAQSKMLKAFAEQLSLTELTKEINLSHFEKELIQNLIDSLKTGQPITQGQALKNYMGYYSQTQQVGRSQTYKRIGFEKFSKFLFEKIGKPNPKLLEGQGFGAAFELKNDKEFELADFDLDKLSKGYKFKNPTDFLIYSMACGSENSKIKDYKYFSGKITLWAPDFIAPKLISLQNESDVCNQITSSDDLYKKKIIHPKTQKEYKNFIHYLANHIDPAYIGNYKDPSNKRNSLFSKWWENNGLAVTKNYLLYEDKVYQNLIKELDKNIILENEVTVKTVLDYVTQMNFSNTNIMSHSLLQSYRFDAKFYLHLIDVVKNKKPIKIGFGNAPSLLNEAKKLSLQKGSSVLTELSSRTLIEANLSLEGLIAFLLTPSREIKYSQYAAAAENFRNKLSEIEASVGLKIKKTSQNELDLFPMPGAENQQKSNSQSYVFEDAQLIDLNLEQTIIKSSVLGLIELEQEIARFVRMKVLMTQGLTFTDEDAKQLAQKSFNQACSTSLRGCR